jgi:hypothetical protein
MAGPPQPGLPVVTAPPSGYPMWPCDGPRQ